MSELSPEMIRGILKKHLEHIQTANENAAIFDSEMMTDEQFEEKRNIIKYGKEYFNRLLQKRENDFVVEEIIDGFLNELNVIIDKESNQYKILKHGIVLNYNKLYQNEEKKVNGEVSLEEFEDAMNRFVLGAGGSDNGNFKIESQKNNGSEYSLTCIWEKFQKEKIEVEHKREASLAEFKSIFDFFVEFAGDVSVASVNGVTIRDFRNLLIALPKNRIKNKKYKDKTIKELQGMDIPADDKISVTTVNKYLGVLQSYFNYAVREAYIEKNPVVPGMIRQSGGTEVKEDARPFTNDELNKIFASPLYADDNKNKFAHRFWIPLIGLFTGARMNEICQLYLDDIFEVDGVWVFSINDNTPDKKIKNKASRRLVPIHPFLSERLHLLNYVNRLRKTKEKRLFPELSLSKSSSKYTSAVSNWFGRFKNSLGLQDENVNFHAFRRNFGDFCKQNKVALNLDKQIYKRIMGHSPNDITDEVYANDFSPRVLYENVMVKINFEEVIDFSHVLRSKFIVR